MEVFNNEITNFSSKLNSFFFIHLINHIMDYRKDYKNLPKSTKDYFDKNRKVIYVKIINLIEESSLFNKTQGYFGSWKYVSKEKTIANYCAIRNKKINSLFAYLIINNISNSGAGGFRTLLVTSLFPDSYKLKNLEVKHRSNILSL